MKRLVENTFSRLLLLAMVMIIARPNSVAGQAGAKIKSMDEKTIAALEAVENVDEFKKLVTSDNVNLGWKYGSTVCQMLVFRREFFEKMDGEDRLVAMHHVVEVGGDLNLTPEGTHPPLYRAVESGWFELAEYMIKQKARCSENLVGFVCILSSGYMSRSGDDIFAFLKCLLKYKGTGMEALRKQSWGMSGGLYEKRSARLLLLLGMRLKSVGLASAQAGPSAMGDLKSLRTIIHTHEGRQAPELMAKAIDALKGYWRIWPFFMAPMSNDLKINMSQVNRDRTRVEHYLKLKRQLDVIGEKAWPAWLEQNVTKEKLKGPLLQLLADYRLSTIFSDKWKNRSDQVLAHMASIDKKDAGASAAFDKEVNAFVTYYLALLKDIDDPVGVKVRKKLKLLSGASGE